MNIWIVAKDLMIKKLSSFPDKEAFYGSLNIENITDTDYRHANKVFKKFKLKN